MTFLADLHIHSRHSRATSKNLDLEHLYMAAQLKGIAVVGTGDATHPGWFAEIREKLVPDGDGLLRLRDSLAAACDRDVPPVCRSAVRFILVSEISNIYKKDGLTRKNHNLVFLPSLDAAEKFNRRLDGIGNIRSDGRPILGLDARDLLEILLETDERAFLVPAHIWTPWFSLLGSKSGFDSLEACFGDLSGHIFAAETGLSSDPAMNRLVSSLDRLTLISNSDAHSASKLAREANIFHCDPGYTAIREALEKPRTGRFGGTIEFYPEEGKYHLDGHRKCGVSLLPDETQRLNGVCPVCGRSLTVGVFSRVQALADRTPQSVPKGFPPFVSLIPLSEILAEVLQVGPATKTVRRAYRMALGALGNELYILREAPPDRIDAVGIPLLGEAIRRMRSGEVDIKAGYDGEFGRIRIFSDAEKTRLLGQRRLFAGAAPSDEDKVPSTPQPFVTPHDASSVRQARPADLPAQPSEPVEGIGRSNRDQAQAIAHGTGPLLIVAGPGTGKTRTLTHRMAHLIRDRGVPAESMLAVTFTEKAADEMRSRLVQLLDEDGPLPLTATFHALCWTLIREGREGEPLRILDEEDRLFYLQRVLHGLNGSGHVVTLKPQVLLKQIVDAKQQLRGPEAYFESVAPEAPASQFARAYAAYHQLLEGKGFLDFEDLIFRVVRRLETDTDYRQACRKRFDHVFVDEYQDLNFGQYRLIRLLVPPGGNICVIGDPDQAIYGFRGSDVAFFNRFVEDYPNARVVHLTRNYRSTETILEASCQMIGRRPDQIAGLASIGSKLYSRITGVPHLSVVELPSEKAEAVAVGQTIEKAVGGAGFLSIDAGKVDGYAAHDHSFADFAVLFRTAQQAGILADTFDQAGIPFQTASRRRYFEHPQVAALLSLLRIMGRAAGASDVNRIAAFLQPPLDRETVMALLDVLEKRRLILPEALSQLAEDQFMTLSSSRRRRLREALQDLQGRLAALHPLPLANRIRHLAAAWTTNNEAEGPSAPVKDAVERLVAHAHHCGGDPERFLASVALQTDADMVRPRVEKVTLSTMHAAKGLEFPVVFIVGCEEGLIPLHRGDVGPDDLDEERRLFYVALTRARRQLYLTWSRKRHLYGRREIRELSPFVADIERRLLKHQAPQLAVARKVQQVQLKLF
jgi:DNA helicase-2/ATP-dependent DNA helicase PcrA